MFRDRKLVDIANKNDFNAWDKEEIKDTALEKAIKKVQDDNLCISNNQFEINSEKSWDKFYRMHQDNFFKNRKWIIEDFKDILSRRKILEIGCGVGSSLHHFFKINEDEAAISSALNELRFDIYGCDFSPKAVSICQKKYKGTFFIHDLTSDVPLPTGFDTILLIFTLSAIEPKYHAHVLEKAYKALNPNGRLYFKDYGVLDMVQLRYKSNKIVEQNFYMRNDGTLTYFFGEDYFRSLTGEFKIVEFMMDKRLLINRKRNLDMYRVYVQCVLEK